MISSVHGLFFRDKEILATQNERGTDIPGGHTESGETPKQALIRETYEETEVLVANLQLFWALTTDEGTMEFYSGQPITDNGTYISKDKLFDEYKQDKDLLKLVFEEYARSSG